MGFAENLKKLAVNVPILVPQLETEEATKNALIMPFIRALGWDVFNPLEVVPEYNADVTGKKGEKVDYAIKKGDQVVMLFEAKKASEPLKDVHSSQLYRYFSVTHSNRIAVLTNGVIYRFYSDLVKKNVMDDTPFLEIDMMALKDDLVQQLRPLTNEDFDIESMLRAAEGMKHKRGIRRVLEEQFEDPHADFVKFIFGNVCDGRSFVQSARDEFTPLVAQTLRELVDDRVNDTLRSALGRKDGDSISPTASGADPSNGGTTSEEQEEAKPDGVETTEEELEGYRVVRAIVCAEVPTSRIAYRDTKNYFGVLFDDNNRKPICRLHFNRDKKYLGIFDAEKNEERHLIDGPEGIYQFADLLRQAARRWMDAPPSLAGQSSPGQAAPGESAEF